MKGARSVDEYLEQHPEWATALAKLRKILTTTRGLEETVKWGGPCYTVGGKNVVGMGAFAQYVALWFFQGVFLTDPDKVLVNAQEGTTRALRQWRFGKASEIVTVRVKAYLREAIENQRAGMEIAPDRTEAIAVPPALARALAGKAKVKKAFAALPPGKRREYAGYIAEAKREQTRARRLAKILPMIEAGVGLNDRYRRC